MNWIRRILALLFGGIFVYAGWLKLRDPARFLIDIRSFDILGDPFAAWLAFVLPWIEIFCGLAVISGVLRKGGLLLLNLALVGFFGAIGYAKSRGLSIQCGCFGGSDTTSSYLELFLRDGILLCIGIALIWLCRTPRNHAQRA
jgi:putative oxidoreductase